LKAVFGDVEASGQRGAVTFRWGVLLLLLREALRCDRRAEGLDVLALVFGWFTEGFDTADLKVAKGCWIGQREPVIADSSLYPRQPTLGLSVR
jgi:hypothetical protein